MEALLALRDAVVHGTPIVEQGDNLLVHDGAGHPLLLSRAVKTPFKSSGGGHLSLDALYLQFLYKDLKHAEFWKQYDLRGLNKSHAVLVQDKENVLSYLSGSYDGADHLDKDFVGTVSGITRPGSAPSTASTSVVPSVGRAGPSEGGVSEALTATAAAAAAHTAMRAEVPLRTRVTILDAPGFKNFSEFVFEFFKRQEVPSGGGAGGGSGSKPGGAKRPPPGPTGGETAARKAKTVAGNPIIIVPNAPTSMITLHNVKQLLENALYVPVAAAKAASTGALLSTVTVTRSDASKSHGVASAALPTTFDVIDNPSKLTTAADWSRVVAVFAFGADWQFKGWTLGKPPGTAVRPVDVFDHSLGFHVHQDDTEPNPNVKKWPVHLLPINKSKRHLDVVAVNKFWSTLDKYMLSKRQYLLKSNDEAEE